MNDPVRYSHRQLGRATLIVGACLCLGLGLAALSGSEGARWAFLASLALVPVIVLVFGCLRIEVTDTELRWDFGWLGWPRWRVPLEQVVGVDADRQSWLEGWGIRITLRGMLYSIGGLDTVRITQRNGKSFRLGTNDLPGLIAALTPARRR